MIFFVSDEIYPELLDKLKAYGNVTFTESSATLNFPESKHADLQYFTDGDFIYKRQGNDKNYPACAETCAVPCGDVLIHNKKCTPEALIERYPVFINVNQGYTRCNACYIASINGLITGNKEIAEKAELHGIKTYFIDDSCVKLKCYDRGFIGGAMGYSNKLNVLFVNGSLSENYPDLFDKLSEKVKIIECSGDIVDIGSILINE